MSIIVAGFSVFFLVSSATSASAADIQVDPDQIWDVNGTWESGHTGRIRAMVWDFQELDGKMYVGGKFLNVLDPTRQVEHAQPFLAAFDLVTGEWDSSFRPQLDGAVYAIDVRSDGQLVVAGEVTGGIVVLDPATGQIDDSFNAGITNSWGRPSVFDIDVVDNQIYAGGTFTAAQGVTLRRLAKFNVQTGSIDPNWTPITNFDEGMRIGGELVYGLEVDVARDRVYVVGKFGGLNGNFDAAYFGILNTTDGAIKEDVPQGLPVNALNHSAEGGFSMWQHDVQFRDDRVYVGGQAHQTLILDADTLLPAVNHSFFTNRGFGDDWSGGDTQVMFLGENTLWAGCHCWGSVGPYQLGSYQADLTSIQTYAEFGTWLADFRTTLTPGQQKVKGLYGINLETNELEPNVFNLSGLGGAWGLYEDSLGQVWAGGQFESGGGRALTAMARFSPEGVAVADVNVTSCEAIRDGNDVTVNWQADGDPEKFVVRRNVNDGANYWRGALAGTQRSFVDSDRVGDLNYSVESRFNGSIVSVECETTIEVGADPVPENLRAARVEKRRVVLNWQANAAVEIEQNGQIIASDSDGWFTALSLEPGTGYTFRVRYVGSQAWSDSVTITTLGDVVVVVNNVAPASCEWAQVGNQIEVVWPDLDATEIIVQRYVADLDAWYWRGKVSAADGSFSDSIRDTDLGYRIKARYPAGDSEYTECTEV